jgi:hypothetical protein
MVYTTKVCALAVFHDNRLKPGFRDLRLMALDLTFYRIAV